MKTPNHLIKHREQHNSISSFTTPSTSTYQKLSLSQWSFLIFSIFCYLVFKIMVLRCIPCKPAGWYPVTPGPNIKDTKICFYYDLYFINKITSSFSNINQTRPGKTSFPRPLSTAQFFSTEIYMVQDLWSNARICLIFQAKCLIAMIHANYMNWIVTCILCSVPNPIYKRCYQSHVRYVISLGGEKQCFVSELRNGIYLGSTRRIFWNLNDYPNIVEISHRLLQVCRHLTIAAMCEPFPNKDVSTQLLSY